MKSPLNRFLLTVLLVSVVQCAQAQTNNNTAAFAVVTGNTAIIPVQRPETNAQRRTEIVLQRAKDNPGECDIAFIGDSITQGWEARTITNVWQKYYGQRKTLNFGVGGDRTQHVLWRIENGQLDGIKPRVAVLLIGTNNSNTNKTDNTEGEILEGVTAIVKQIRTRLPDTKIILVGIFPRGKTFSVQRGKILEVNEALAKLDDGKTIRYIDFGPQLIDADGSISPSIMRDFLHLTEAGYEIWAAAMEPTLKEWLGK
jgi:lysophospholipase L1-like esterase